MFHEETDKIERLCGGMPDMIHLSVVASKRKPLQEDYWKATELMDRRINTFGERTDRKTRGSLKMLLEITKTNNQTKGRTQAGLMLPGTVTKIIAMKGLKPLCPKVPLQEGLPLVEEQEPGKWQRCSQGICSGSCRAKPRQQRCDGSATYRLREITSFSSNWAAPVATGTLSIGPIRNERIGGSTTRAFRQGF
ncbi:hypothetical protein Tco_0336577 [Tanacetum coccineum]